jgi:hypothetical protein
LDANLETKNSGTSTLIETFDFAEARREDVRKHASKPDPIECYKKKNIEGYNLENKIDSVCIIMAEGILQTAPKPTPNLG